MRESPRTGWIWNLSNAVCNWSHWDLSPGVCPWPGDRAGQAEVHSQASGIFAGDESPARVFSPEYDGRLWTWTGCLVCLMLNSGVNSTMLMTWTEWPTALTTIWPGIDLYSQRIITILVKDLFTHSERWVSRL